MTMAGALLDLTTRVGRLRSATTRTRHPPQRPCRRPRRRQRRHHRLVPARRSAALQSPTQPRTPGRWRMRSRILIESRPNPPTIELADEGRPAPAFPCWRPLRSASLPSPTLSPDGVQNGRKLTTCGCLTRANFQVHRQLHLHCHHQCCRWFHLHCHHQCCRRWLDGWGVTDPVRESHS